MKKDRVNTEEITRAVHQQQHILTLCGRPAHPNISICKCSICHGFAQPKVAQLDDIVLVEKDILRLDIPMQDDLFRVSSRVVFSMAIRQGQCNLGQVGPDHLFPEQVVLPPASLDLSRQIPIVTEFHDDVQSELLAIHISLIVANDILIGLEILKNVDFFVELLEVALVHPAIVEFLSTVEEASILVAFALLVDGVGVGPHVTAD